MAIGAIADEPIIDTDATGASGGLTVAVYSSLSAAEPVWRELETRSVMTPYQQFDWIDAYCRAGFERPDTIAILVLYDGGKAIALIPFGVSRRYGIRQAQIIGVPISNCDHLLYDPAYADRLTREAFTSAFAVLNRAGAAADIVSFHCLVPVWQGHANPLLVFDHTPAPNNLYVAGLGAGERPFIEETLPHKRRSNIRRSQRGLADLHGEVVLRLARTEAEVEQMHAAFLDQRAKRFRQMGVENIFASAPFQTLFRSLAIASLGQKSPTFRYHALYAGEEIVATSLGLTTPVHYSQYINSTTDGPAARYSLMGVMLSALIDELRVEGITSFDMGLGDFGYKTDWTQPMTVFDCVIPVSPLGRAAGPALLAARRAKRLVKQTPALWQAARTLRTLRTRLREGRR